MNPFVPRPLLQIPTRADVAGNQGVCFVACEAGTYTVATANPRVEEQEALDAGAQRFRRDVTVGALTVRAGAIDLPWQGAAPATPALTLFLTEEVAIAVTGGNGGTYRVRLADDGGPFL